MNIFDNDLYKFTMWNIVNQIYPDIKAEYKLHDRKNQLGYHMSTPYHGVCGLKDIWSTIDEQEFDSTLSLFRQHFPEFNLDDIKSYYFNKGLVCFPMKLWKDRILFEVPALAELSENYYKKILDDRFTTSDAILESTLNKLKRLNEIGKRYNRKVIFSEMGTRRRISQHYQSEVLRAIKFYIDDFKFLEFKGTSNIYLGLKHNLPIVGTMAHEWVMSHTVLNSIHKANTYALRVWKDFYGGLFKTALTDTYGYSNFFNNFDSELEKHYSTLRHDSGDPVDFLASIEKYGYTKTKGKIESTKTILFSDSINDGVVEKIFYYLDKSYVDFDVAFGIGTWFTAKPYDNFETLNIVIKLDRINGFPVCKLSSVPGKESGDKSIIELTKETLKFFNEYNEVNK